MNIVCSICNDKGMVRCSHCYCESEFCPHCFGSGEEICPKCCLPEKADEKRTPMSKDLENIALVEKKIGIKLKRYDEIPFWVDKVRGLYRSDEDKKIVWLNLSHCFLSDISFLRLLPNVRKLNLSRNEISDYSILKDLPNLVNLDLRRNNIIDISVLKYLQNLISLDLSKN
jgi:hypothetical protein